MVLILQGSVDENFEFSINLPPLRRRDNPEDFNHEHRCWKGFPHPALGPHPASCALDIGSFAGGKVDGALRGVDHQPVTSSTEVTEKVELYFYSSSTHHLCLHDKL
jgi:hypothetical protein